MGELAASAQAGEVYRSLAWNSVPAELLIYLDEGHIFRQPSHKKTKLLTETHLARKRLLGLSEPGRSPPPWDRWRPMRLR